MYLKQASEYIKLISESVVIEAQEVVDLLTPQSKVVVFALGKSYHAAMLACSIANSFGLRWYVVNAGSALHGDIGVVGPKDTCLFVSNSGKTEELIKIAVHLRDHKKIAIVGDHNSPLALKCDKAVFLPVEYEYSPFGLAPMTSSILQTMFLNQVACLLVEQNNIPFEVYSNAHIAGTIGELSRSV